MVLGIGPFLCGTDSIAGTHSRRPGSLVVVVVVVVVATRVVQISVDGTTK